MLSVGGTSPKPFARKGLSPFLDLSLIWSNAWRPKNIVIPTKVGIQNVDVPELDSGSGAGMTELAAIALSYTGSDQTQRVGKGTASFQYDQTAIGPTIESAGSTTYYTTTPSGQLVGLRRGGARYYYVFDGLGSVVGLTDSAGSLVNSYAYDPFGIILTQTEPVAQPYKFAGVYFDSEYGFYKMGARYYDPAVGRFTQADPAANSNPSSNTSPPVWNLYSYSKNDPVNFADPSGLWYIDFNVTIGFIGGVTFGMMFSQKGVYTYKGSALTNPPGNVSVMFSRFDPTPGRNVAGGFGYWLGMQGGYEPNTGGYFEAGFSTPGVSVLVFDVEPLWIF